MDTGFNAALRERLRTLALARGTRYQQLGDALKALIAEGAAGPAGVLPPERELARVSGLSRVTVRKALAGLVAAGVVHQRAGSGTFVGERIVRSFSRLTSFTEDLRARGLESRVVFLARSVAEVTSDEAMALALSPGSLVVRLHRLRLAGEQALAVEETAVPHAILTEPERVGASLYETLTALGAPPVRAIQRLRAVALDTASARHLGLTAGGPALHIERRAFLADGRAVEFTRSIYRADVYDFVAELTVG
jgi:GntR family transcriptional regulator